jgi:hypothetical protein
VNLREREREKEEYKFKVDAIKDGGLASIRLRRIKWDLGFMRECAFRM